MRSFQVSSSTPFGANLAGMMKTCGTASSFFADAITGLRTRPALQDWAQTLFTLTVFAAIASYLGLDQGLFKLGYSVEWPSFIAIAVIALLIPALVEEFVFRGVLAGRSGRARGFLALLAFVAWHPLQVWLGLPFAQPVFLDPAFLVLAAMLGAFCTFLYRSTGSLWPPILFHWLVVLGWKTLTVEA